MRLPLGEKCQPAPANLRSDCMSMNAIITAMVIIVGSIATVLMLYLTVLVYRDQARDPEPKTHPPHRDCGPNTHDDPLVFHAAGTRYRWQCHVASSSMRQLTEPLPAASNRHVGAVHV